MYQLGFDSWYFPFALLFWLSAVAVFHTYLLYPLLLKVLAHRRPVPDPPLLASEELPPVSVLMAVYNEDLVIEEKLQTLLALEYPTDRLRIFVGSDRSVDETDAICRRYADRFSQIRFQRFEQRTGKPGIINTLFERAAKEVSHDGHLLLLTDANVFPRPDLLKLLTRHFQNPAIALVDAHMQHTGADAGGIAASEDAYIQREVRIKHYESVLWQQMIGPFGGCFAMRASLFEPVPTHYKVDDFYLAMSLQERGYRAVNDLAAICTETVGRELSDEFRRKRRIGTGNFQNMWRFRGLWLRPWRAGGFALLSHKILRWLTPFALLLAFVSTLFLAVSARLPFYQVALGIQVLLWGLLPLLDLLLPKLHQLWRLPRHVHYFLRMNLALLLGFYDWLRGVHDGTWEPVRRG